MIQTQCNIQGRPTPNRYEKRGGTTFQSFLANNVQVHGVTEFGDVSNPPRKYLQNLIAAGGVLRFYDPNTWSNRLRPFDFTEIDPSDGTRVRQFGFSIERPGGTLADAGDSVEQAAWVDDIGQTVFADNPGAFTRNKRSKILTGFTENEPELPPQFEYSTWGICTAPGNEGCVFQVTGTVQNGAWRLTVAWFPVVNASSWTVRISAAPENQAPSDASAGFVIGAANSATVTVDIPPDYSVKFHIAQTGGADYFPTDFGADYDDAGADLWIYLPAIASPFCSSYVERLAVERTYSAAIAASVSPILGRDKIAFTTGLSGGTSGESYDPLVFSGKAVLATHLFTALDVGNSYTLEAEIQERDYPSGANPTTTSLEFDHNAVADTFAWTVELKCPLNKQWRVIAWHKTDNGPIPSPPTPYNIRTALYHGRLVGRGGTISTASLDIANALIVQLVAANLFDRVYITPFLGNQLVGQLTPIGGLFTSVPTNTNFVNADCSEATGLQGNGTDKFLRFDRTPNQLGASGNGGVHAWALAFSANNDGVLVGAFSNAAPAGFFVYGPSAIDSNEGFIWSLFANQAKQASGGAPGLLSGRRSSATSRTFFRNGISQATNTVSDTTGGNSRMYAFAAGNDSIVNETSCRLGAIAFDDGTLSDAEELLFFQILRDYLMTPTGRIP